MRVHRRRVELDFGLGFIGVQQRLLHAHLFRGLLRLFRRFGPVVRVVGDAHDDFLRRHVLQHLTQVLDEPVLRGDRAGRRSQPVLVVVHQHDGVALFAEKFVIVGVVARGKRNH